MSRPPPAIERLDLTAQGQEFVDGSGGELQEHVSDEDYLAAPAATE